MVHTSTSPKIFDNRRPLSKKDCLRCIIVLDDLLAAGIVELRSAKPATYYQYILRFKKLPLDSAKMAELRKEMDNDCDGEAPQFAVPAVPLPPPVADQDLGIVMMSSGDEGDDPGPKPPSPAAHPELGPPKVVPELFQSKMELSMSRHHLKSLCHWLMAGLKSWRAFPCARSQAAAAALEATTISDALESNVLAPSTTAARKRGPSTCKLQSLGNRQHFVI